MNIRGANSADSIPIDLVIEILSRLPSKSIARFRCVSKLWGLHASKPYFTELFLKRSSARPRLLIGIRQDDDWFFFSAPQPQNPYYETSSLVVAADFHMKFKDIRQFYCTYASGLLHLSGNVGHVICNPSTGQFSFLPQMETTYILHLKAGLIGFDPIGRQFKVLSMNTSVSDGETHCILTLGTEKERWRKIQCPSRHYVASVGTCISGVLYHIAYDYDARLHLIGCFDVRTEKFKFLNANPPCFYTRSTKLINYKGKLGVISLKHDENGGFPIKIWMWVLEDIEKQKWSTYVYTLRAENEVVKVGRNYLSVVGVTASGEIVLLKNNAYKPFYVFYFNPERNTLLTIEIQGVGEYHEWSKSHRVNAFVDHVEDLHHFNIMKTTSPPEQKRRPTIKII